MGFQNFVVRLCDRPIIEAHGVNHVVKHSIEEFLHEDGSLQGCSWKITLLMCSPLWLLCVRKWFEIGLRLAGEW